MRRQLMRDERGGVLVEVTALIPILLVFVLGGVDFLFAFYQWNAAGKAVERGARIAAVSNPVADGLNSLSNAVLSSSVIPGDPMPSNAFTVTCNGNTQGCNCSGTCTDFGSYNLAAMRTIVFGRQGSNATSCPASVVSAYNIGMCHMFWELPPQM